MIRRQQIRENEARIEPALLDFLRTREFERQFWSTVNVTDLHGDGCWLWKGRRDKQGRCWMPEARGRLPAQLVAWLIQHQELPPTGRKIIHTCARQDCVRPSHLILSVNLTPSDEDTRQIRASKQNHWLVMKDP